MQSPEQIKDANGDSGVVWVWGCEVGVVPLQGVDEVDRSVMTCVM
jgi:hypothetical protein